MSSTKAAVEPAMCSATATNLRIPFLRRSTGARSRAARSGAERRERLVPLNELLGLGPDDAAVAVELAVEQEPAHVAGATQKRDEPLAREPLHHVATRVHQVAPHGPHGGVARPYEERAAPFPPAAQVLARRTARGWSPEHEEPRRPSEGLLGRQRGRGRYADACAHRGLRAAAGCEVDLDDLTAARPLQSARRLPEPPERGQRNERKKGTSGAGRPQATSLVSAVAFVSLQHEMLEEPLLGLP